MKPIVEKAINAGINWLDDWSEDTLRDVTRTGIQRLKEFVESSDNSIDDNILKRLPAKIQTLALVMDQEVNGTPELTKHLDSDRRD